LLDALPRMFNVCNDRQFALKLDMQPRLLCNLRNRNIDAPALLPIHLTEETNFTIRQLRALMGDYQPRCGPSAQHPLVQEFSALRTLHIETRGMNGIAEQTR
jgi:hypothetical protein